MSKPQTPIVSRPSTAAEPVVAPAPSAEPSVASPPEQSSAPAGRVGPPTLEEYVQAGYKAENYEEFLKEYNKPQQGNAEVPNPSPPVATTAAQLTVNAPPVPLAPARPALVNPSVPHGAPLQTPPFVPGGAVRNASAEELAAEEAALREGENLRMATYAAEQRARSDNMAEQLRNGTNVDQRQINEAGAAAARRVREKALMGRQRGVYARQGVKVMGASGPLFLEPDTRLTDTMVSNLGENGLRDLVEKGIVDDFR